MIGKVALITGSAKGLGKGFAEAILKRGGQVMLSDLNISDGNETLNNFKEVFGKEKVLFQHCDVTKKDDLVNLFLETKKRFGKLDIVCNNAGILHETEWEQMIKVNLMGMIRGTKLGIEHMRCDEGGTGGVIVNISSAAGLKPVPFSPSYCATKYGILGFTRSQALHPDFKKQKVRVNCLCPFFTDTDIVKIKKDQVLGIGMAIQVLKMTGLIEVKSVVDAFLELVENENLNGAVMDVNVKRSKLVDFPPHGFENI